MRVAVDGSPLCLPLGGIGQYTHSLLAALARQRPHWEFLVLSPYRPLNEIQAPNIFYDPAQSKTLHQHAVGWRAWWFDAVLPDILRNLRAEVFWAADGQAPFRLRSIPVALTIYDFAPLRYPQTMSMVPRYYRRLNQQFWLSRCQWKFPISMSVGQELRELHDICPGPVVYPGVDEIFREAVRSIQEDDHQYLIAVGTIEPRKNFQKMLKCVQLLVDEGIWPSGLQLRLVGGKGWRDKTIVRVIQQLEDRGIVRRLGFVPRAQLPGLLAGARALLMPSLYEGFGMPVAEALTCGCPVVCSDIAPFREIATDGNALFHGTDTASMLAAYRRLLLDPSVLPLHASQEWVRKFDWLNSAETFAQSLEQRNESDGPTLTFTKEVSFVE